jgi:hypothetical protein
VAEQFVQDALGLFNQFAFDERQMNPNPLNTPSIQDAISAVETAITNLNNADQNQAQAQARFDAAYAGLANSQSTDVDATTTYNGSLLNLIAAAQASMRPVGATPTPTPTPAPPPPAPEPAPVVTPPVVTPPATDPTVPAPPADGTTTPATI